MSADEFALIGSIREALGDVAAGAGVVVGPGDDAAVLTVPAGHESGHKPSPELVVSTDTLVAGCHFPADANPDCLGYRGMAVATSDLAAMGAEPAWAVVALTAPALTPAWAVELAAGVRCAAERFGLKVAGGNIARGPLSLTVTVAGHLPAGTAITRGGAAPEDRVYVTGALGGAALALAEARAATPSGDRPPRLAELHADTPRHRYWQPAPRLAVGAALRGVASAAIDISDGLGADLDHLCAASGVCLRVELERLPVFPGCDRSLAASAGDDYELAFTAPPRHEAWLRSLAAETGVAITPIGVAAAALGDGCRTRWSQAGTPIPAPKGYRHF